MNTPNWAKTLPDGRPGIGGLEQPYDEGLVTATKPLAWPRMPRLRCAGKENHRFFFKLQLPATPFCRRHGASLVETATRHDFDNLNIRRQKKLKSKGDA